MMKDIFGIFYLSKCNFASVIKVADFATVGGKGGYLFEEFLLSSIILVLSQFCVPSSFLHSQAKRSSDFRKF